MRDPDGTRNFFPDDAENVIIYNQFVKHNDEYLSYAIEHTEQQANLEAPWRDNGNELYFIDLQRQKEKGNLMADEEYDFLDFGEREHDDDSIARRKEKQKQEERNRANRPSQE